jgi:hypothetical protein
MARLVLAGIGQAGQQPLLVAAHPAKVLDARGDLAGDADGDPEQHGHGGEIEGGRKRQAVVGDIISKPPMR